MLNRLSLVVFSGLFMFSSLYSQNVAINTTGAAGNASAMLDVDATNMGLLIPRVALTATNVAAPVAAPATSLLIYNTATAGAGLTAVTPGFYYWDGVQWVRFQTGAAAGNSWLLTGNAGTNDPAVPATYGTSAIGGAENWIGTTDAQDFVIGTNTIERFRVKQTTGYIGIGTAAPSNLFTINHVNTTVGTTTSYPFAIQRGGSTDYTIGSDATFVYEQSWNAKPFLINSQGNRVGINMTTAPVQNLDVNGRINVANGVLQRGNVTINITSDLGLYSQVAGNWIRIAANAAPIKFFVDQGGGNGAGTNAAMNIDNANGGGIVIAEEFGGTGNAGVPNSRAALEINSITKGFLVPRFTTAQRDAITLNVNAGGEGLLIYNTTTNCFEYWDTQATPIIGATGFWNSLCDHCDQVVVVSASQAGFNLNTFIGGALAKTYCVYVQPLVTLQGAGNGGGSGAAGNPGFDCSTMPAGSKVILYNYGNILGGGGNGGIGAQESDAVCAGDAGAANGGAGGHAIVTSNNVPVTVNNYGTIRAGGGGGGGAGAGCCSAGGGGGGGAGTPVGAGGPGRCYNCTGNFICGCGVRTGCSAAEAAGTALVGGVGGGGAGSTASGCSGNANGGTGASGGANGIAGAAQGTGCCSGGCGGAAGGAAGLALQGNGSGSSMNNFGTVTGGVNP